METSLHQQLKLHYAGEAANTEVVMGDYRIDAVRDDELIEVQCASLSAINRKIAKLVKDNTVRVVKPVTIRTRIAKKKSAKAQVHQRRYSPKRGDVLDVFDDLIYFTRVFPHRNLILELVLVDVQQVRVPSRRRRSWQNDYCVVDVQLEKIHRSITLRKASQLFDLIGLNKDQDSFTTIDIAQATGQPRWMAQKIAYVLKHTNAITQVGRKKQGIIYRAA
ncbi:hypothetical protein SV7mr_13110 [Stieleria bergensis]|uniref:DUF8091 domain-containing protein n=1 Tax=Stieleria bergensis TaxID=2528025 RepID=A0A517SRR2_9BACT|nr:hypothetical protein SV7mr_13110 [Planctomycetes bacterium SV_7m_r]